MAKRKDKDLPLFDLPLHGGDEASAADLELEGGAGALEDPGFGAVGFEDDGVEDGSYEDGPLDDGASEAGDFEAGDFEDRTLAMAEPVDGAPESWEDDAWDGAEASGVGEDPGVGEVTEVVADPPAPAAVQRGLFEHLDDEDDEFELDGEVSASPVDRLLAGLADLGVHAGMLGLTAAACIGVGVPVTLDDWPPFAGLALVLSFLYWIIPLAFWGQTPGMAWIGTASRSEDDEPLSFGQAVLRWVGALCTGALVGLPLVLAFGGGRSLSDRMSDSKTLAL